MYVCNFHPLEVVGHHSEKQLQVGENINFIITNVTMGTQSQVGKNVLTCFSETERQQVPSLPLNRKRMKVVLDCQVDYQILTFHPMNALVQPFKPSRCMKASFYILENRLNFPTTKGFRINIPMKLVYQYMAIFFNF